MTKRALVPCCDDLPIEIFKALCDTSRMQLIFLLLEQPRSVQGLASNFPLHMSVVSRHLKTLKEAGVVTSERRGKEVFYSVGTHALAAQLRKLADMLDAFVKPPAQGPARRARTAPQPAASARRT